MRGVVFFKQKTAYEIEYGLVGSEMCIRDRPENLRSGTVEKAHEDGINELTKQWVSEARSPKQCNIPNADAKIEAILNGAVPGLSADEAKKTVDEGEAAEVTQAPASVPATNAPATSPAKKAPTHTRTPVPVSYTHLTLPTSDLV